MARSQSFNTIHAKRLLGPAAYQGLGVGNVYHVFQTGQDKYAQMYSDLFTVYSDGSVSVYNTITAALAKTVAERNDYVIVYPDATDYDEGATLALSATSTHLICPAGIGPKYGCIRAVTIDPASAAHAITISGRGTEFAGFWIRGYADKDCIRMTAAATGAWVHHNECACTASGTLGNGIYVVSGASGVKVENNFVFANISGGTVINGIRFENGCTRSACIDNFISVNGATFTYGIQMGEASTMDICEGNVVHETSGVGAGTITNGIVIGTNCIAVNNKVGITTTANAFSGGTADESYVGNYQSKNGGQLGI
jgi:hypothetical protein